MIRSYIDKRRERVAGMQSIVDAVKTESRAMDREEAKRFRCYEREIQKLDMAIENWKRM